jgi:CheY-like chemotaxis protein
MNTAVEVKYQTVWLVDDNTMENMVHEQLLDTCAFAGTTKSYVSADDTLKELKSLPLHELPQVIFLDIIMPGMDGFAFLDEFSKLDEAIRKKCKVVLLSSSDSFKDLNRANKNPLVRKFLNKPLTPALLSAINL